MRGRRESATANVGGDAGGTEEEEGARGELVPPCDRQGQHTGTATTAAHMATPSDTPLSLAHYLPARSLRRTRRLPHVFRRANNRRALSAKCGRLWKRSSKDGVSAFSFRRCGAVTVRETLCVCARSPTVTSPLAEGDYRSAWPSGRWDATSWTLTPVGSPPSESAVGSALARYTSPSSLPYSCLGLPPLLPVAPPPHAARTAPQRWPSSTEALSSLISPFHIVSAFPLHNTSSPILLDYSCSLSCPFFTSPSYTPPPPTPPSRSPLRPPLPPPAPTPPPSRSPQTSPFHPPTPFSLTPRPPPFPSPPPHPPLPPLTPTPPPFLPPPSPPPFSLTLDLPLPPSLTPHPPPPPPAREHAVRAPKGKTRHESPAGLLVSRQTRTESKRSKCKQANGLPPRTTYRCSGAVN
ncbi:hypothetical protein C7M84_002882 [Penaeus vannamei]|uniref:Uncharacterized protein n=1 Tax=Penaeus vannamei TaxID=6689 RepID=A0A3R7MCS2_PENVA|nr:hypothetical protein C7M84_002882 [Penaeus vannamei]